MKLLQKRVILPMAAVGVLGAALVGANFASADSTATNPRDSLIQKLADKFHVDKSQVQAVFDQHRTEMQAQMEQKYEDRLTQAVKDGQLTEDQKSKVLAEHNQLKSELESQKDSLKDSAPADRKAAMDKIRTEAQDWAKQNNIDAKWLMPMGMRHGHGFGGPGSPAPDEAPADTQAQTN